MPPERVVEKPLELRTGAWRIFDGRGRRDVANHCCCHAVSLHAESIAEREAEEKEQDRAE
jgi:hypothetical protein